MYLRVCVCVIAAQPHTLCSFTIINAVVFFRNLYSQYSDLSSCLSNVTVVESFASVYVCAVYLVCIFITVVASVKSMLIIFMQKVPFLYKAQPVIMEKNILALYVKVRMYSKHRYLCTTVCMYAFLSIMLVEKNRLFDTNYQAVKGQQFLYFRMHKKVALLH